MTEALTRVVRFGLDTIGFDRVQAMHDVRNPASGRVMLKSGLAYEGRLRSYTKNGLGEIVDVDLYAIINSKRFEPYP
jgi:RimJ/RimL family protein N-acetyltransferase